MEDFHLNFYMVSWLYETAKPNPFENQTFVYDSVHSAIRVLVLDLARENVGEKRYLFPIVSTIASHASNQLLPIPRTGDSDTTRTALEESCLARRRFGASCFAFA